MPRMGGSSRDSYTNVDTAVGTIVWVRRRNGSWWPGRIISDAELSTANLLSPRSGTPVKLLGREDGSVDWYNIEKSKRVKPFRCGDFEECIDKAKAVAGLPTKKREKYARREDAILHALELERQQLSGFVESSAYRKHCDGEREVSTLEATPRSRPRSRSRRKRAAKPKISEDDTESGNSRDYVEEEELSGGGVSSSGRAQEEQDWNLDEDDEVEGLPRMRGLQDFGLRTVGKGKRSIAAGFDESNVENHNSCLTQSGKCSTTPNGTRVPTFTTKRKRTGGGGGGGGGVAEDGSSLRKRDRRRPISQVLESSAKFLSGEADGLMRIVDDDDALVEGNQTLGGLESMGVEFTSSPAEGCREEFANHAAGVADRTCCSFSGHATGECCDPSEDDLFDTARRDRETDHQRARRCLRKLRDEGAAPRRVLVKQEQQGEGVSGETEQVTATRRPASRLGQIKAEKETAVELFDVPVLKDNNVQKPSVPMVLLASKLTRRPVVGYPVVVAIDGGIEDEGFSRRKSTAGKKQRESLPKKLVKKVMNSSRKTRTLSSISGEQRFANNCGAWNGRDLDGKTEEESGSGWPVACIPVRVALSRILAAVSEHRT